MRKKRNRSLIGWTLIGPADDLTVSRGSRPLNHRGVGQDLIWRFERSISLRAVAEIVSDKVQGRNSVCVTVIASLQSQISGWVKYRRDSGCTIVSGESWSEAVFSFVYFLCLSFTPPLPPRVSVCLLFPPPLPFVRPYFRSLPIRVYQSSGPRAPMRSEKFQTKRGKRRMTDTEQLFPCNSVAMVTRFVHFVE